MNTDLDTILAAREAMERALELGSEKVLKPLFEKLLDSQKIQRLYWVQYTPYFNDGDPCVFSVCDMQVLPAVGSELINHRGDGFVVTQDAVDDWAEEPESWPELSRMKHYPEIASFLDTWGRIPKPVLEKVFGEHSRVMVRRDPAGGIIFDIEEYEHD